MNNLNGKIRTCYAISAWTAVGARCAIVSVSAVRSRWTLGSRAASSTSTASATSRDLRAAFDGEVLPIAASLTFRASVGALHYLSSGDLRPEASRARLAEVYLVLKHGLNVLHIVVGHGHRNDADESGDGADGDAKEGGLAQLVGLAILGGHIVVHLLVGDHFCCWRRDRLSGQSTADYWNLGR